LISDWKRRNLIILKNWGTKLTKNLNWGTKLKITIITATCHDCKLPRGTMIN